MHVILEIPDSNEPHIALLIIEQCHRKPVRLWAHDAWTSHYLIWWAAQIAVESSHYPFSTQPPRITVMAPGGRAKAAKWIASVLQIGGECEGLRDLLEAAGMVEEKATLPWIL